MIESTRPAAMTMLCSVLEDVLDPKKHDAVLVWLGARSEAEGGFLWLAGQLGCRPSVIEATIKQTIATAPIKRFGFSRRVRWLRLRLSNGYNK